MISKLAQYARLLKRYMLTVVHLRPEQVVHRLLPVRMSAPSKRDVTHQIRTPLPGFKEPIARKTIEGMPPKFTFAVEAIIFQNRGRLTLRSVFGNTICTISMGFWSTAQQKEQLQLKN